MAHRTGRAGSTRPGYPPATPLPASARLRRLRFRLMPADALILRQPDDWHTHLRDGEMLRAVVGHTARQFARAIVMPNLRPPITTVAAAPAYRSSDERRVGKEWVSA